MIPTSPPPMEMSHRAHPRSFTWNENGGLVGRPSDRWTTPADVVAVKTETTVHVADFSACAFRRTCIPAPHPVQRVPSPALHEPASQPGGAWPALECAGGVSLVGRRGSPARLVAHLLRAENSPEEKKITMTAGCSPEPPTDRLVQPRRPPMTRSVPTWLPGSASSKPSSILSSPRSLIIDLCGQQKAPIRYAHWGHEGRPAAKHGLRPVQDARIQRRRFLNGAFGDS